MLLLTFLDLIPFFASGLVLIFTALLVLLAEDDLNDSKVLSKYQLRLASNSGLLA
jgi:hypothetical protein